ncbi:MAG: glycoside hydrolase family 99-like domain-containing protein [Anaerolineae bacterium]
MPDIEALVKLSGEPRRPQMLAVFVVCFLFLTPLLWSGADVAPAVGVAAELAQNSAASVGAGTPVAALTASVPPESTAAADPGASETAAAAEAATATLAAASEKAAIAAATATGEAAASATEQAALGATATAVAGEQAGGTATAQAAIAATAHIVQVAATSAAATGAAELAASATADALAAVTAATAAAEAAAATSAADALAAAAATALPAEATAVVQEQGEVATETVAAAPEPTATPMEATATAAEPTAPPTEVPATATPAPPPPSTSSYGRLVLGNYFAWFDGNGWDDCNISAGDKPLEPYSSDDPAAIRRQVEMAIGAGLDGFVSHWFAPGERTDANFATLLGQSQGTGFRSTVMFLRHIWAGSPAPTVENIAEALRYIMSQYSGNGNFLRAGGKPVIFFTDVYRVPGSPVQTWQAIRDQVDPNREALWIAEGLDASYLAVFDGLYVYKITHAAYPDDYVKASRWAGNVRAWEQNTGQEKLWIATISPGLDDLRAGCRPDVRVPSAPHRKDRADGAFYQATYDAAMQSAPDWLFVQSWNEWVEGTYIEPSVQYGDRYLQMTRDFAARFKGG